MLYNIESNRVMIIVEDVGIVGRVREVVYREKMKLLMRGLEEVEFEVK